MPSPSIVAVNHHSHIVFWVFDSWHISLIDSKLKICINDCGLPGWFMLIWGSEIFQTPLYSQYMPIKPTCLLLKSLYWYPCHIFQHISKTKDRRKQLIYHKSATSTINPICCLGGEKEIQYIYIDTKSYWISLDYLWDFLVKSSYGRHTFRANPDESVHQTSPIYFPRFFDPNAQQNQGQYPNSTIPNTMGIVISYNISYGEKFPLFP